MTIMKDLKFRVWDKHDKRMKYAEMEWFDDMFAFRFDHRGFEEEDNSDVVIMQYTGLNDRRNVEVYEGDILEPHDDDSVRVVIEFKGGQFYGRNLDVNHPIVETQNRNWLQWDIIGNIHENTIT